MVRGLFRHWQGWRAVAWAIGLCLLCMTPSSVWAQSVMATWLAQTQSAGATPQDPPQAPQATPVGPGAVAANLVRVGVDFVAAANSFNADNWPTGGFNVGRRFEWSLSLSSPYVLDQVVLTLRRSAQGARDIRLDMRVDGGAWTTVDSWTLNSTASNTRTIPQATLLSALGSLFATGSVQFRLLGSDAGNALGTLRITNAPASSPPVSGRGIVVYGDPRAQVGVVKSVFIVPSSLAACTDLAFVPTAALWNTHAALPGSCLEYRITATNTGLGAASVLALSDDLGANLFRAFAGFGGFAQVGSCTVGAPCTVSASAASLAAGGSGGFRVRVHLP